MPNPTLMQAVLALINAETEAERKRVLESQRDLLLIPSGDAHVKLSSSNNRITATPP